MRGKKGICAALALCLAVGLAGCGVSQQEYDKVVAERDALAKQVEELGGTVPNMTGTSSNSDADPQQETKPAGEFDEDAIVANLEVKKYEYTNSIKRNWIILVVKNTSPFNLSIEAVVHLKDAAGEIIGVKNQSEDAFEKGTEIALEFRCDDSFASYDYEISVKEEEYYECIQSSLEIKTNMVKDKAIVTVTNTGDVAAEFVKFTALFFRGDTLVYHDTGYTIDDDSELKPGKTISAEADCYEDYDSVQVYLTGRA